MKSVIVMLSLALLVGSAFQGWEDEQLENDLIGALVGEGVSGSRSHVKELLITNKREDGQHRIYSVTVTLQDPRVPEVYEAEADVTYTKVDSRWEVEGVGLKSLTKVE
ncbi:MAG: hypothetical protein ACE5JQ_17430 [Candidatus Methylomirabilales bacterium]